MNIVILGAGAIGSLWGYQLTRVGHQVSLWTRQQESHRTLQLNDHPSMTLPCNREELLIQADLVLITVKAWQIKSALTPVLEHVSHDTILLFMHNGMGAIDELNNVLLSYPVVQATTTHGAYKQTQNRIIYRGTGNTQLGGYNTTGKQCAFLADVLKHALPNAEWIPDMTRDLLKKLAVNCAINPLTAVNQCPNGKLLSPEFTVVKSTIIQEINNVFHALDYPTSEQELTALIDQVILATADNFSSMQQDIVHHRKTEIDYITGYLLNVAARYDISIPENQTLYRKIKTIESSWTK